MSANADVTLPAADFMPEYSPYARNYVYNVTILVLLTYGGELPSDLWKTGGAIELAVRTVRQTILPEVYVKYYMASRPRFGDCYEEENHGGYMLTKFAMRDAKLLGYPPVGLLVGPGCTKAMESLGRLTADMKLPHVTSQGYSSTFDAKGIFKTTTRTGITMKTLSRFTHLFVDQYNFTSVAVIYDDVMRYSSIVGSDLYRSFYFRTKVIMNPTSLQFRGVTDFTNLLYQASNASRVIFVLGTGAFVRQIMLQAYDLHMTNGEYVFVTCNWYNDNYWGKFSWKRNDDRDEDAKTAYKSLFMIKEAPPPSAPSDNEKVFQEFTEKAKQISWSRYGFSFDQEEELSPAVSEMYDAITLWATAVNETLYQRQDPRDGIRLTKLMWNRKLKGINGTIYIDQNGDRDSSYFIHQMDYNTGLFKPVIYYAGNNHELEVLHPVKWYNRDGPPPNEPECGYTNKKLICLLRNDPTKVIGAAVGAAAGALIIFSIIGFLIYRKLKMEQALKNTWWRVNFDEMKFHVRANTSSRRSLKIAEDADEEAMLAVASYQDRPVMVRGLKLSHKIDVSRDFLVYLSKLHTLTHENLSRVVGICVEPNREAILTEFCSKGRLNDLLGSEDMNLDWGFQSSLITDLVSGLGFLHNSFVSSHGDLNSGTCVIDSRFSLKITDYAFPQFRSALLLPVLTPGQDIEYGALLWRAPELLRDGLPEPSGTQKGDIYAMAIILSEIVTRRDPYTIADPLIPDFTAAEIVHQVTDVQEPPFRPVIAPTECPPAVASIIRRCWEEDPKGRPAVPEAQSLLKENGVAKGSVMDNIIKRMEQYASNLEGTVGDRTKALMEEKKKVEELLYEILPRAVADALKAGQQVPPEAFEMVIKEMDTNKSFIIIIFKVTIYFSDIVGFTTLSAKSTAFQVVDLLNDLYVMFDGIVAGYDAYKVETIGDAYVVASGVPKRNENRHAPEIAKLALNFQQSTAEFKIRHLPNDQLKLRIGLHSGYCAAGVVGVKMPRYCLFGETVQMANKMESTSQPSQIQISEIMKKILDEFNDAFEVEFRHALQLPNNTSLNTYWLRGEKSTVSIEITEPQ